MDKLTKEMVFPETTKFLETLKYSDVAQIIAKAISVALDRDCASINERMEEVVAIVEAQKDAVIAKYDKRNMLLSKLAGMRRLAIDNDAGTEIDYAALKPIVFNTLNFIYDNNIDYRDLANSLGLKVSTTRNGLAQFKSERFIKLICCLLNIDPYTKNEQDSNS